MNPKFYYFLKINLIIKKNISINMNKIKLKLISFLNEQFYTQPQKII